ncbi:MAG: class I SAM-dependent methyltransferase [Vicinamibacterales bacterium]
MTDSAPLNPPSPFIAGWVRRVAGECAPGSLALDFAMGRGRHALVLAEHGFRVVGIDIQFDAVSRAMRTAQAHGLRIAGVCADLTTLPLPAECFETIVVTRYLDRTMFPSFQRALVPGGVLLYETFTERQRELGRGPTSRAHLLRPGELRTLVRGMDVLFDEECATPDAVARIAARKR